MDKKYMAVGSSMLILKLLEQQDMYGYQIIILFLPWYY